LDTGRLGILLDLGSGDEDTARDPQDQTYEKEQRQRAQSPIDEPSGGESGAQTDRVQQPDTSELQDSRPLFVHQDLGEF
jgi:hypothetical protein